MKILNSSEVLPVSLVYQGDSDIDFREDTDAITTNDGYLLYDVPLLKGLVDIKLNKRTILGLTSSADILSELKDESYTIPTVGPFALYVGAISGDVLGIDYSKNIITTPLSSDFALSIVPEHVKTVAGVDFFKIPYRNEVLTISTDNSLSLSAYDELSSQHIKLLGTGNQITLISEAGLTGELDSVGDFYAYSNDYGFFEAFSSTGVRGSFAVSGFESSNAWVRYDTFFEPDYNTTASVLSLDSDTSISGIATNLIVHAPISSITVGTSSASLYVDLIPTKNFKTVNSSLSLIETSGISGSDTVDFRDYNRIYSGGSQTEGYSNINLGFSSEFSSTLEFKPNGFTYFHVPDETASVSIQDAGFEYSGAVVGGVPIQSDRLYKRLGGYEDQIWWGGGVQSIQNGTWLCAWLSGDDTQSVWMERYFDPGVISIEGAMSYTGVLDDDSITYDPSTTPVWDVTSTMTINPREYFKYYHVGVDSSLSVLESLKGDNLENLVLLLSDFDTESVVNDESNNNLDGTIYNYENSTSVDLDVGFGSKEQTALLFNSDSEIHVAPSTVLDVEDESTMNCWAYSENWNDGQSSPIFSHYNKGGYKLEYMNHGLYYSYIFPSQGEGKISIIPANITDSSELINTLVYGGNPESVAVDLDGYIWISAYNAISTETRILKLSPSARVLESVNIENIQGEQIIIADDDYGYIKTVTGDMRKFNLNSMAVTTVSSVPSGNYIYVDADGTLGSEEGSSIDTFIDGTTFVVNDGVLTRDGVVVPKFTADDGSYQMLYNKVVCDNDSYYFLTMNDEEETDSDQNVTSTAYLYMVAKDDVGIFNRVSIDAVGAGSPNAVFLAVEMVSNTLRDVVYWITESSIKRYKIQNNEMVLLNTITLDVPIQGEIDGDLSGYGINKIAYKANGEVPYLKYSMIVGAVNTPTKVTMTTPYSTLNGDWNFLSFVKNTTDIKMYLGYDLLETAVLPATTTTRYLDGAMVNLGGYCDGEDSLIETLQLADRSFNGGVSEFTIFSVESSQSDIKSLYLNKFTSNNTMYWVLNTGTKFYVEEIENVFKFKKPGIKSQFFNVVIKNMDISTADKTEYETVLRAMIAEQIPANMKLVDITWR